MIYYTIVKSDTNKWWILDRNGSRVHTTNTLAWAIKWTVKKTLSLQQWMKVYQDRRAKAVAANEEVFHMHDWQTDPILKDEDAS